jgi:MarR family transcriptional regulator, organic hydroperoxide resistance regulator
MNCERETFCKCLYYSANALSRNITRLADKAFEPVDLAPSYAFVLITINRKPGLTAGELATIMQLQPSTVTRFIESLEKKRYIQRINDGKFVTLFPLRKSTELQEKLLTCWQSLYKSYSDLLGKEEADKLAADMYNASSILEHK